MPTLIITQKLSFARVIRLALSHEFFGRPMSSSYDLHRPRRAPLLLRPLVFLCSMTHGLTCQLVFGKRAIYPFELFISFPHFVSSPPLRRRWWRQSSRRRGLSIVDLPSLISFPFISSSDVVDPIGVEVVLVGFSSF